MAVQNGLGTGMGAHRSTVFLRPIEFDPRNNGLFEKTKPSTGFRIVTHFSPRTRMLLSIDPGADLGWALFDPNAQPNPRPRFTHQGLLVACGFRQFPSTWPAKITRLVVERPHTGQTRARKKDVITLALRAGEVAGIWSYITGIVPEYFEPATWKGSISKTISVARTRAKLYPEELRLIAGLKLPKAKEHNVLDAIGIGLYILRR